ncbi:hypothetical protein [Avibacterium sp. 21-599]|uniref:hypothetical protein n=1 Tax=Avibacterium sp. 21-599 TaxID=2911528 RepID=UPI002248679B|nr:hypothetical protein [Avibacterium sp. 21-599]MCW9718827.1 hypothetical protein [Avibacterium sp. 21-599]
MSNTLFLVKYDGNEEYYDDTSKTLEKVTLKDHIYERLEPYLIEKMIYESKGSDDMFSQKYIDSNKIADIINDILIPECVRESEKIDKQLITSDTESKILSFGDLASILKIFTLKRDNYSDNQDVLLMVG